MKIALVTTFFHPVTGGVETHVLNLARQLQKDGYEIEVLASDSNKAGPRIKDRESIFLGVKVKRFFTWFSLSYYHKFFPGLFLYLMRSDADIFHVHGFRKLETYFCLLAARLRKKKVILTTHNPFPTSTRSGGLDLMVRLHDMTLGKIFTRRLDRIITLVKSEGKLLEERFGVPTEKVVVIPNGIEEQFFEEGNSEVFYRDWGIEPDKWDAIAVGTGRINITKGFQNLELAVSRNKNVLFFFAGGDDGYLEKLKFIYAKSKNVMFSERFLAPEKLRNMYAAADLFVFPSLHEAFGIVLLEALAQGVPVISTNSGGPAEILNEETAVLLKPEAKEEWAKAVLDLSNNKSKQTRLIKNGQVLAEKFRWPKVARQIGKVYSQLVSENDSRNSKKRK